MAIVSVLNGNDRVTPALLPTHNTNTGSLAAFSTDQSLDLVTDHTSFDVNDRLVCVTKPYRTGQVASILTV